MTLLLSSRRRDRSCRLSNLALGAASARFPSLLVTDVGSSALPARTRIGPKPAASVRGY
jgi:hypothetical protein